MKEWWIYELCTFLPVMRMFL